MLETDVDETLFVMGRTTWIDDAPITMVRALAAPGYHLITRAKYWSKNCVSRPATKQRSLRILAQILVHSEHYIQVPDRYGA
ncbi:hypothetical protein QEZ52_22205 (plasmid) [Aliisedimentitalea scapharcae]|uniref:Uncharacterized protein n=1 Tax=Aliisedimentitalea scapharcae TaxID=1524259 RepID=A0ABZ2Y337_9RHOB